MRWPRSPSWRLRPRPTRATRTSDPRSPALEPVYTGLEAEVLNFDDSRPALTNETGEEVVVIGYEGEPYVRIWRRRRGRDQHPLASLLPERGSLRRDQRARRTPTPRRRRSGRRSTGPASTPGTTTALTTWPRAPRRRSRTRASRPRSSTTRSRSTVGGEHAALDRHPRPGSARTTGSRCAVHCPRRRGRRGDRHRARRSAGGGARRRTDDDPRRPRRPGEAASSSSRTLICAVLPGQRRRRTRCSSAPSPSAGAELDAAPGRGRVLLRRARRGELRRRARLRRRGRRR